MVGKTRVRKGQVWERKRDGIKVLIIQGKGQEWKIIRPDNPKIQHHMTAWNLNKEWRLLE